MVMKTMLHRQLLNNLFILFLLLISGSAYATGTKWEVAIIFRGEYEDDVFQKDIDQNIQELSKIAPSSNLKIGIYREGNDKKVPGTFSNFLKTFFKDKNSKKATIIYSHGKGADGLKNLSNDELKEALLLAPHLDFLWFDACFMANIEFLYEMRSISDYTIASEETEFTSGLPFETLDQLPSFSDGKEASLFLAKNFIESYSYIKNGTQRDYVSVSSATISVVENEKLEFLVSPLKEISSFYRDLSDEIKIKLKKTLSLKASMDKKDLIDLGIFLIELRRITSTADQALTRLIRLLNIEAIKKLKTNPRIHILNPGKNSKLIYGFNNWSNGSKNDFESNDAFRSILKNNGFIAGPRNSDWPYKTIESNNVTVTPFAPGINTFNYYFINSSDGKLLTKALSVSRTHDIVETDANSSASPLTYTAYTQQVGTRAERYTGLNISMPESVPSMDYIELEFNQLVQWLHL